MVISALQASPRPSWAKTGSWRKYMKTSSSRKLLQIDLLNDESMKEQRSVRFSDAGHDVRVIDDYDDNDDHLDCHDDYLGGSYSDLDSSCSSFSSYSSCTNTTTSSSREARWYTKNDYERFEKDRQLTALQYRSMKKRGTPFIEREHSVRGLEDLLEIDHDSNKNSQQQQQQLHQYDTHRKEHARRVLEEQERQRTVGTYPNPTMMHEVSVKSSREARNRSAALGEADALAGYVTSSRAVQRQVQGVMHSLSRKIQR